MIDTHLWHVTLTTGHARQSYRHEVGAEALAALAPVLAAGGGMLAGLRIALDTPTPGGRRFRCGWRTGADDVVAIVCWQPTTHARWWTRARTEYAASSPVPLAATEPPWTPWLAVWLLPAAAQLTHDEAGMLGDAERCVAWALMEEAQA